MMDATYKPRLLKLADYSDPILRNTTQPVEFPLSDSDKQLIQDMIYSIQPAQLKAAKAPWEEPVGMAANQWGVNKSIFLYCPSGDTVNGLEVVINPSYEPKKNILMLTGSEQSEWEGCFSVPLAAGKIKRDTKIKIRYQNMQGEVIEGELSGWPARVWQHENDHLNGYLYDDARHGKCLDKRTFKNMQEVDAFYDDMRRGRIT